MSTKGVSKVARVLASRLTLGVAAVVFVGSLLMLPIRDYSLSYVGQWVYDRMHSGIRLYYPRPLDRSWFVNTNGRLSYLDPDQELLPSLDQGQVVQFDFWYQNWSFGWWAATTTQEEMRIDYKNEALNIASAEVLKQTYVDYLVQRHEFVKQFADELKATARAQRTSTRWLGWFHNAVSLVSLLVVITSAPQVVRNLYRCRLTRQGLCPNCSYDRAGLVDDVPCPECGAALPPMPTAKR